MKKQIAASILILALMAALTACTVKTGGNPADSGKPAPTSTARASPENGNKSTDIGNSAVRGEIEGWPVSDFPSDFPAYPDGNVESYENDGEMTFVYITGSGQATYDAYKETLTSAGWTFEESTDDGDLAVKGSFMLSMSLDENGLGITLSDTGMDLGNGLAQGWPADLPFALPIYPEGEITKTVSDKTGDIWISIDGTSTTTYNAYVETLIAEGWEFLGGASGTGTDACQKDGHDVALSYTDGGTSVFITIMNN